MPQFMSVEVSGEMVGDLMNDDPNFALEVLQAIAVRTEMGLLRDNIADVCADMRPEAVIQLSRGLSDLSQGMRDGFNMAHHSQQI